jgi:U3 small nucleolar RNA-associated protein 23
VPLIFGLRNALFLESPSAFQKEYVRTSEEGRLHMTNQEYQIFRERAKNRLAAGEADNSNTEIVENKDSVDPIASAQAIKRSITSRNKIGIKDRPQFKRKRAKVILYF